MKDIYCYYDNYKIFEDIQSIQVIKGIVDAPFFSIFIPTYKRIDTLCLTIESAVSQIDFSNYEIIIIDNDYSEIDDVKNVIEKFNDSRISLYYNENNIGLCGNWNRGIELSKGKYVTMIHDDDVLSPWFLSSVYHAILDNNFPSVIGTSYTLFDSFNTPVFSKPDKLTITKISKKGFFFGKNLNVSGLTIYKNHAIELGGYAEEYYPNEDTILIYQSIIHNGVVINVNHSLTGYRKEMNLSLKPETMERIIYLTEMTRKYIAKHEKFAEKWMKIFDKEFLYDYILGANNFWGLSLKCDLLLDKYGFKTTNVDNFKYRFMKILLFVIRVCV